MASQIEKIHTEETTPLFYNNEQSLRSVIKLAYFSGKDYYIKFEELPAGNGSVDIVYFPKKDTALPALVIELKWNKKASGAIEQIKKNVRQHICHHFHLFLLIFQGYLSEQKAAQYSRSRLLFSRTGHVSWHL